MMGPASLFAPTVDLHDVFPGMFYEDDIHPEIQIPGRDNSAIHLKHLYQKKKKSWVPLVMSNITGGVDINW